MTGKPTPREVLIKHALHGPLPFKVPAGPNETFLVLDTFLKLIPERRPSIERVCLNDEGEWETHVITYPWT